MLGENKENLLRKNREQVLDKEGEKKRIFNHLETMEESLLRLNRLDAEREHLFEEEYQYVSGGRYQHKFEQKTTYYQDVTLGLKRKLTQSMEELEEKQQVLTKEMQDLETQNDHIKKEMVKKNDEN